MTLTERIYAILNITCDGMSDGYPLVYGHQIREESEAKKAYAPDEPPTYPWEPLWWDNTTAFEAAHAGLLGKIYNIDHDVVDAPLSLAEQDAFRAVLAQEALPVSTATSTVTAVVDSIPTEVKKHLDFGLMIMFSKSEDPDLAIVKDALENCGYCQMFRDEAGISSE